MNTSIENELSMKQILRFNQYGRFKILMMSDLHWSPSRDIRTLEAMHRVLDAEMPDLVLLGGDNITDTPDENDFAYLIKDMAKPMEQRRIPWAHVFGNHDGPTGISKKIQQKYYNSFPYCISKSGPKDIPGIGNYVLPILAHDSEEIIFVVWGLDSHQCFFEWHDSLGYKGNLYYELLMPIRINGRSHEDFIRFEQLMWYWNTSKKLERLSGKKVPGIMYFHIPLYEFYAILYNSDRTKMRGECNEDMCNSEVNSGLFSVLLQRGDVKGVFCGHDHTNSFEGIYCGIRMGYVANIGYGPYGIDKFDPSGDRHRMRGSRVFELNEKNPENFETRMVYIKELK